MSLAQALAELGRGPPLRGPVVFFPRSGCIARSVEVWLRDGLLPVGSVRRSNPILYTRNLLRHSVS